MFSFFDKRSMEAADLNALLLQIKELLAKISFIYFPIVHEVEESEIYCFVYQDFSHLYDCDTTIRTEDKVIAAVKCLFNLVEVSHCLEEYSQSFNNSTKWFPPNPTAVAALDAEYFYDFDLAQAFEIFDTNKSEIQDDYAELKNKISAYLHHLIFLETNAMVPADYFLNSSTLEHGEIFTTKVLDSLKKQGVLEKGDKESLQYKIEKRHGEIVASLFYTVYMDCSP